MFCRNGCLPGQTENWPWLFTEYHSLSLSVCLSLFPPLSTSSPLSPSLSVCSPVCSPPCRSLAQPWGGGEAVARLGLRRPPHRSSIHVVFSPPVERLSLRLYTRTAEHRAGDGAGWWIFTLRSPKRKGEGTSVCICSATREKKKSCCIMLF